MNPRSYDAGFKQRRMTAFGVIVALHIIIGWGFVSGFGNIVYQKAASILQTTIIKQEEQKALPPPPPKPELERPPPMSVPIPIINVNVQSEAPAIVVNKAPPPAPKPVTVVASTPVKTVRQPDCGEDYYPAQALRLGQAGSAVVKLCVGVNNKIDGPIELVSSSGFPSLDEAAGRCMSAGSFRAGTVEGKPTRSCKEYRVTFKPK